MGLDDWVIRPRRRNTGGQRAERCHLEAERNREEHAAFRQKGRRAGRQENDAARLPALANVVALMVTRLPARRRYRRPLSLMAVPLDTMLASRVRLRFTDLFAITPDGDTVLVMLPETEGSRRVRPRPPHPGGGRRRRRGC